MIFSRVQSIMNRAGYVVNTLPYQLNIVGLRSRNVISDRFDDEIHVFYKVLSGKWNYHVFKATTDPGTFWLNNPDNPQGTAILAQGQYINSHSIGMHRGKYKALVQANPVTVIRDYNRDAKLDFNNGTRQTGVFGINIHHASINGTTKFVEKYSAGCQVFADINDFNGFMSLCDHHAALYGNHFTYTLLDFRAMRRETWRRVALAGSFTGTLLLGYIYAKNQFSHLYNMQKARI